MFGVYDRTRYSGGVEMSLIGPFSVGFPVNFKSGGDTTRDAFGQHIEEIKRIYGILNALDAGKVSASDVSGLSGSIGNINTALTNHINSTNPHPNYKPSVSWSDLTGTKPNLADLNGNLPMSRITGNLDASRINGLPTGDRTDKGDGITESTLAQSGYVKFNNGFIFQWWTSKLYQFSPDSDDFVKKSHTYYENFLTPFQNSCFRMWSSPTIDYEEGLIISVNDNISIRIVAKISGTTVKTIHPIEFIAIGV